MLHNNNILNSNKGKMTLDPNEWKKYQKKVIIGVSVDNVDSKPKELKWETLLKFDKK
jgi:hypothetical protein